jgi:hypothetical protein
VRASGGSRIEWPDVPADVRDAVDRALGSPVVEAASQPGGFSPGVAARCRLADGGRVFVKAVSAAQNRQSPRMHRREAEVAGQLPTSVPAPRLLHVHDDGHWVALAFEDIDGRQPQEPWTLADLDVVMPAIADLGRSAAPAEVAGMATVMDRHRSIFDGWRRLASGDGDLAALPQWVASRIDQLAAIESGWEDAAAGDALLHADLRADNVLIRPDRSVVFVDWPWACRGAAFVDPLLMLWSIGLGDGPDPAMVIERYGLADGVDDGDFLAVSVAVCGFFARSSQDDPPPGLPALRAFQRAQRDVGLAWLRSVLP